MNRRLALTAILIIILPVILAACGGGGGTATTGGNAGVPTTPAGGTGGTTSTAPSPSTATEPTTAAASPTTPTGGTSSPTAAATGAAGTGTTTPSATGQATGAAAGPTMGPVEGEGGPVTVMNQWSGTEQEGFQALAKFCDANYKTQIKSEQVASMSQLPARVSGGNPPDVATVSSPGQVAEFARGGSVKPVDFIDQSVLKANLPQYFIDLGTVNGKLYTIYMKAANKSLVWYSPKRFQEGGYQVPKTYEEMVQLSAKMAKDGNEPWAFGVADAWTLTDWFENVYLRIAGPEKYDQLIAHKIPWTDPSVKQAFDEMKKIMGQDKFIAGGRSTAMGQKWADAAVAALNPNGATAEMFQEADFVGAAMKQELPDAKPGTDFDAFPFPPLGNQTGATPVVAGPDGALMFKDTPGARAFMRCLLDPRSTAEWAKLGGYTSPNLNVPLDVYPSKTAQNIAKMLVDAGKAGQLRMDGSDLMPSAFGGDYFGKALQRWFQNPNQDMNAFLQDLEANATKLYPKQ